MRFTLALQDIIKSGGHKISALEIERVSNFLIDMLLITHFMSQMPVNVFQICPGEALVSLYPQELLEHPHISAVAVCGIPDAEYGQAIGAVVVAKPDTPSALAAADIIAFAKTKVASYAAPRRVVFLQELPVNAMGKVSGGWRESSNCMRCE